MTALLIDGENLPYKRAPLLFQLIQEHADPVIIGCLYGTTPLFEHWKPQIHQHRLHLRSHKGGRNAADRLLARDARTLIELGLSTFLLASDDGDFLPLVIELQKTKGCTVLGFGTSRASQKLQQACKRYYLLDQNVSPSIPAPLSPPVLPSDIHVQVLRGCLEQIVHHLCAGLVPSPHTSLALLQHIASDPHSSSLLTGERKNQWTSATQFAQRCEDAYLDGTQALPALIAGIHLAPPSPPFSSTTPEEAPILRYWWERGSRQRSLDLLQTAHLPWTS